MTSTDPTPRASTARSRVGAVIPRYLDRFHRRRQIYRKYAFRALGRFTPRLAVDEGGIRYYVSTTDLLGREVFMTGHFEMNLFAGALSILGETTGSSLDGKAFVDIGANIGTTLIPALKLFGASYGYAFEPEPTNLKLLKQNIIENDIEDRVTVVPVALSDVNAAGTMELAASNWGDHRIRLGIEAPGGLYDEDSRVVEPVELRRFDDVAVEVGIPLDDVGLAWLDVQGHEGHVLAGATSLLASSVPVVTEYWPYGLRRMAGLSTFHELAAASYRQVIDVRASVREHRVVSLPANELPSLEAEYSEDFTDLLFLT